MREFHIMIRSLQDVKDFVALSSAQPFPVIVGSDSQNINGKDFMGMFSLDYRYPQRVQVRCSEEEFASFLQAAQAFVATAFAG
mgnify:CR=1 FL=1